MPSADIGQFEDADALAHRIVARTGGDIRLALPLGLGKANTIANALTRIARDDPAVRLRILTALTLQVPKAGADLERRFLEPASERLFGAYPELLYARMMEDGTLPANIEVHEFFVQAGRWIGKPYVQQNFISANYTHALDYVLGFHPNVVAQLMPRDAGGRFSLSCNTDITVDLLKARRDGEADFLLAVEVNDNLPFMGREAIVEAGEIDLVLAEPGRSFELFSVVRRPVSLADIAIGLSVSQLIEDGGTIQIGIGSIGDAIAQALILRQNDNARYRSLVDDYPFGAAGPFAHAAPFEIGLYAVTEMLVGGILELFDAGIIRREVDGAAIHAGFFLECRAFYERLRTMPPDRRDKIVMKPVSFTNSILGDEAAKRATRVKARFVNNAMIATCLGAVTSDTNADGQVVSGVGGQFDFVSQAFALRDGRSVIVLNAVRESGGETVSNIRWSFPTETVPRHFRDIIVTEYGVADLYGKSDAECVKAMLAVTDSRFQEELLAQAKAAGKIDRDYALPQAVRGNTPQRLAEWLAPARRDGTLPAFPFGTDFTETEQRLLPALAVLKQASRSKPALAGLVWEGATHSADDEARACLDRLALSEPENINDRITAFALRGALRRTSEHV